MNNNYKMIRYGTVAEQKYIDEFSNNFDVLIINANMISYASKAISKFVSTQHEFSYLIDPLTHSLQHKIDLLKSKKGEIKTSFSKMIESYSDFVQDKILDNHTVLTPKDFEKKENIEKFTDDVINFQVNHVLENVKEQDLYEYLEYAGVNFDPLWYIVPYFSMNTRTFSHWLPVNIELIKYSTQKHNKEKLASQIVIEQDVLQDREIIKELVESYSETGIDKALIWVDNFSAFEASPKLLRNFCYLIKLFNDAGVSVYNLYGDYFSVLLCHDNSPYKLNGVCHGIEYGEKRAVIPVGGGIPINKYYYYPIHQRISYGESATALTNLGIIPNNEFERYFNEICNCSTCTDVIGTSMNNFEKYGGSKPVEIKRKTGVINREFPTTEAKSLCIKHFLNCKYREWGKLEEDSLQSLISNILETGEKYQEIFGYDTFATFDLWNDIFKNGI